MVLFTSGWTVPLAFSSVGRSRLSTLTVWNSSGWSMVRRLGSTVISCFVGAALVSLEQATATARRARHNRKAAAAPQESADCTALAALKLKKYFACDVMGLPRGRRLDLIGWRRTDRSRPGSRRPVARCGTLLVRSGNPATRPRRADRKRKSSPERARTAAGT